MSESRAKLNEVLRDLGYDVRGDLVVVRPKQSETLELRRSEHALVADISTDIGSEFRRGGIRLERFRKNPVVLWAHDYDGLPIARCLWERVRDQLDLGDSKIETLIAKSQFHLDTELSREAWSLVDDYTGVEWQLGVVPVEWRFDGGACVTKWDLVEISAVPSDVCKERIRIRIKDRRISSPAMLRSVEGAGISPEPTSDGDDFDEAIGPYSYQAHLSFDDNICLVLGPQFIVSAQGVSMARKWVDELNDAWRRGHDYVAADAPEPPSLVMIYQKLLDDIEERVAELEKWRRKINEKFAAGPRIMDNPR